MLLWEGVPSIAGTCEDCIKRAVEISGRQRLQVRLQMGGTRFPWVRPLPNNAWWDVDQSQLRIPPALQVNMAGHRAVEMEMKSNRFRIVHEWKFNSGIIFQLNSYYEYVWNISPPPFLPGSACYWPTRSPHRRKVAQTQILKKTIRQSSNLESRSIRFDGKNQSKALEAGSTFTAANNSPGSTLWPRCISVQAGFRI